MGADGRSASCWTRKLLRFAALVALLSVSFLPAFLARSEAPAGPTASPVPHQVARRETRPTLDPGLFVGKAAVAHRVAREIPDVLDQLYCYCQCDKHAGHKSLLSCYTDGHAAT